MARAKMEGKKMNGKIIGMLAMMLLIVTIVPSCAAEMTINKVTLPNVVTSSAPNFGELRFNIMTEKFRGQNESLAVPIVVNGTTMTTINIQMKVNETLKTTPVSVRLQGATILITNPYEKPRSIPSNTRYEVQQNPFSNPISSIQYEVEVNGFTKNITLLVYADWRLWAIIGDIVVVIGTFLFIRRLARG